MGSFVLDFSAYNALLSSNGHGTSYYGVDDAYLGGGDPGLTAGLGRRPGNLNYHLNQQQQQQHQQQQQNIGQHVYPRHQISNRYIVHERNSLARLEAERSYQDRRKQQIANFGSTWLKPPGVAKTLFQIREEHREQEEQAEAERREELAQQLAQAEAAALAGADGTVVGDGGEGPDLTGEPGGATDLLDGGNEGDVAAGMHAEMMDEDGEQDLDNDVPDADDADFSFGNNDDQDDPFASSSEDEDEDEDEDESEDGDEEVADAVDDSVVGLSHLAENNNDDRNILTGAEDDAESVHALGYPHQTPNQRQQMQQDAYMSSAAIAVTGQLPAVDGAAATPGRSIEEERAQARARAAERHEMRQLRAAEDRMRALRAHPRLSGAGMTMGMGLGAGLSGDDEDLDEEDQAQMLQEEDLIRVSNNPNASGGWQQQRQGRRQSRRQRWPTSDNDNNIARGNLHNPANNTNSSSYMDDRIDQVGNINFENEDHDESGLELDMNADLDDNSRVSQAMELSAFDDESGDLDQGGSYEHTDTEAELSSSVLGVDDDNDEGPHLPQHNYLASADTVSGRSTSLAAPRLSGISIGSLSQSQGHGYSHDRVSTGSASGAHHRQRLRSSLARSDRNSMDISSFLSQDGSSAFGSSPQLRRL
ncbi:hypothetical protein SEPCBS119000_000004 [Sporothrix epigloea]|uniref:Anaphase-promoting complex, subunit 15/MND2 n=1 Tax=Sporothrix epigloea TaxID=1892477 RepID=A0ABP0D5K4_9PEZI